MSDAYHLSIYGRRGGKTAALRKRLDKRRVRVVNSSRSPERQAMAGTWADIERSETPLFRSTVSHATSFSSNATSSTIWFISSNGRPIQFNPAQCAMIDDIGVEEFPPELRLSEGF